MARTEDNGLAVTALGLVLMALLVLFLLGGCATTETIRLGPGECAVLTDKQTVIVAGSDCKVQRLYR